uniref:sphingosine 1-phosphate receptor 3-like n=1 Tax=Myxine glutinosa TaxID=7769 RepID=UPI00358E0D8B
MQAYETLILHYNHTGKLAGRLPPSSANPTPGISQEDLASKVLLSLLCVTIIIENLMVLIVIFFRLWNPSPIYLFIANLAATDLLAGLSYLINLQLSGPRTFELSINAWFAREASVFVALAASVFGLLAIALERYVSLTRYRLYSTTGGRSRVAIAVVSCWALAIMLGCLPGIGWNCIGKLENCSTVLPLYDRNYILFAILFLSGALIAVVTIYGKIYTLVKTSRRQLNVCISLSEERERATLLRSLFLLVLCFLLCWGPLFGLLVTDTFCSPKHCSILHHEHWFLALALANSVLNPPLYPLASRKLRFACFKLPCFCCCHHCCEGRCMEDQETELGTGYTVGSPFGQWTRVGTGSTPAGPMAGRADETRSGVNPILNAPCFLLAGSATNEGDIRH